MGFSILHLPDEVLILILAPMPKRELKSMRLTSRFVEGLCASMLFNRAYFSGFPEDLSVLKSISRHERLRHFVKEIVCCSFYNWIQVSQCGRPYEYVFKRAVQRFPNVQSLIATNNYELPSASFKLDSPLHRKREADVSDRTPIRERDRLMIH